MDIAGYNVATFPHEAFESAMAHQLGVKPLQLEVKPKQHSVYRGFRVTVEFTITSNAAVEVAAVSHNLTDFESVSFQVSDE